MHLANMISKVYIVILNYNSWSDTIECLESVFRNRYDNYQVIVIDNNSTNNSMNLLKMWADGMLDFWTTTDNILKKLTFPPVPKPVPYFYLDNNDFQGLDNLKLFPDDIPLIMIQTGHNLGFAGGNNIAIKLILSKNIKGYIWLLNPDMLVEKQTLKRLVDYGLNNKDSVIGCHVKDYSDPTKTIFLGGAKINIYTGTISFISKPQDINKLDYISGGSLFTHVDNFDKIGLLPEDYFLYWEDTDWCTQGKHKGLRFSVCLEAVCYTKTSSTIGKGYLSDYYYTLNAIKYVMKFYPHYLVISIIFCNTIRVIKRLINLRFSNAVAIIDAINKALFDYR
jgi:GT2 family glycosyltransferase